MGVVFDEAAHTYTSTESGNRYISVTTLIKEYVPPFDSHYWSTYKAAKEVMTKKGMWSQYKMECGGWDNVVIHLRTKSHPLKDDIMKVKLRLLEEWKVNAVDAAKKGTAFHKAKEAADRGTGVVIHNGVQHAVQAAGDPLKAREFDSRDGLFPELLLWDDELQIAGTSDWVLKVGDVVHIKDYKTSKKVDKAGFMDEMLLWPVNHLLNANFFVYGLQLSLYGYLLERKGYTVGTLAIEHIDRDTHRTIETYPTEYYKTEIEKLLKHWGENKKGKRT